MSIDSQPVLPESIAEHLRVSILDQTDAPGSALTESAVAVRFGVARHTARLAIDKLVADGLLRREPHSAARIPVLSRADVIDLFDNRAAIESAAMAALALTGTVPAEAIAAHHALAATSEFARQDIVFHRALVAGQASPRLTRMHSLLMGEIELCIGQLQAAQLLTTDEVAHQHQVILDAITSGDPDAAASLVRTHIAGARDRLLTHFDK